jgi:GGDEF domain-containing protein
VVLSSVAAADDAERRAQSLLELIGAPRGTGQPTVRVSIGVATDDGGSGAAEVLRRADEGLLHAKHAGGGQVSL